jgi:RNA polymerase sigma-54 factor
MNNLELREYIDEKFVENPFLIIKYNQKTHHDFIDKFPCKSNLEDEISKETAFLHFSDFEREIAKTLIHNIGDDCLNNEILRHIFCQKKLSYLDLLAIINRLKKTSFAHMFAFNLQDKLKTFLENNGLYNGNYQNLIKNITLVLSGDRAALKAKCGVPEEELSRMISSLKNAFSSSLPHEHSVQQRQVDLVIEEESLDEFKVTMDEKTFPEVEFDHELYAQSQKKCRSPSDKSYVKNNASAAKLLVKSTGFRSSTLLRIANEIVYRQLDFFLGKDLYLTPISTQSIAYSLFLHESTVNRAILGKSIATPRGIFELRSLLPRRIKSYENKVSEHSIKEYMKKLIKNEPKENPYSDCHIASFLNTRGINISRRTISKYRDILHIPNLVERTKIYKIAVN